MLPLYNDKFDDRNYNRSPFHNKVEEENIILRINPKSFYKFKFKNYQANYTAPIINRQSEGVAIKEGLEYLKTIVASYELRTSGHMSGNFELFAYFSENKLPRVLKKS